MSNDSKTLETVALDTIERWRSRSMKPGDSLHEYMEYTANRIEALRGEPVITTDPVVFVSEVRNAIAEAKAVIEEID